MSQKKIITSIGLFCLSYTLCLLLWIQLKPYYGSVITLMGSEAAAGFSSFSLDDFEQDNETANIGYSRIVNTKQGVGDLVIELKMDVSNYSFNIPLTVALIAALFPIIRWNSRSMTEVFILIIMIHFLYVFFYSSLQLFYYSHPEKEASLIFICRQYFLEFMWTFIDNMVVKFEPFLVALYLIFRKPGFLSKKKRLV